MDTDINQLEKVADNVNLFCNNRHLNSWTKIIVSL